MGVGWIGNKSEAFVAVFSHTYVVIRKEVFPTAVDGGLKDWKRTKCFEVVMTFNS